MTRRAFYVYEEDSEYYSEEYSAVGLDSEELLSGYHRCESMILWKEVLKKCLMLYLHRSSPKSPRTKRSFEEHSIVEEDYEEINRSNIHTKATIVEVVWDPTIFSDPNLQDTKARGKHQVSNPTTHEVLCQHKNGRPYDGWKHHNNRGHDDEKELQKKSIEIKNFYCSTSFNRTGYEMNQMKIGNKNCLSGIFPKKTNLLRVLRTHMKIIHFKMQSNEIDLDQLISMIYSMRMILY